MAIKFLYVLAVLALLNHGRIIPKMKNGDPVTVKCVAEEYTPPCLCDGDYVGAGCICTQALHPQGCVCDADGVAPFTEEKCQTTKNCVGDTKLEEDGSCTCADGNNDPENCACSGTVADVEGCICSIDASPALCKLLDCADDTAESLPCKCKTTDSPEGCVCPTGAGLADVPTERCPCDGPTDDRRGTTCPIIKKCESNQDTDCVCDGENLPSGCKCTDEYHPAQCVCDTIVGEEAWLLATCTAAKVPCVSVGNPTGCTPVCEVFHYEDTENCLCTATEGALKTACKAGVCVAKESPSSDCGCPPPTVTPGSNADYTHDKCLFDKLEACATGDVLPEGGCLCAVSNLPIGCTCTDEQHPAQCVCNSENAGYSLNQCNFDKLATCDVTATQIAPGSCVCGDLQHHPSGCICASAADTTCMCNDIGKNPGGCQQLCTEGVFPSACVCPGTGDWSAPCVAGACTAYDTPTGCGCSTIAIGQYTKQQCLDDIAEAEYAALRACEAGDEDEVVPDACKCTPVFHPQGCKCPLDDKTATYTQERCLDDLDYDALDDCTLATGQTLQTGECKCLLGFAPEGCDCPLPPIGASNADYTEAVCVKEKLCHTLVGQSKLQCECLAEEDPRQGTICPVTDLCAETDSALPCICNGANIPTGCTCSPASHPKTCECDDDTDAIFDESIDTCTAVHDYDQLAVCTAATGTAGDGACQCLAGKAPRDCQCPLATTPGAYTKAICEAEKIAALPACDGQSGASVSENTCKCVEGHTPENCVCPVVPAQLATIPVDRCQCLTTGDPRAGQTTPTGAICPAYCEDNVYVEGCACDSSLEATYDKCREDKAYDGIQKCAELTAATVGVATCICDGATNSPIHCVCPKDDDIADLAGVPSDRCGCLSTDDPRAIVGGLCPLYCVKDTATADCTCDSAIEEYTVADCTKEKACKHDLAAQTKEYCPCTGATDPRIAGVCKPDTPATVDCTTITKDTPVTDCVCPTDKKELKADPRSGKGGLCAAGSMRAALAVVVSALIIPALILFF